MRAALDHLEALDWDRGRAWRTVACRWPCRCSPTIGALTRGPHGWRRRIAHAAHCPGVGGSARHGLRPSAPRDPDLRSEVLYGIGSEFRAGPSFRATGAGSIG